MAEPAKQDGLPGGAKYQAPTPKPKPKQFSVLRMMGLPQIRWKLPSRNWMIFLTVTGTIAGGITYDRRQKKAVQKKWCDLVAHIAQEPLGTTQTRRKLTIFLSAPPGDGIRPSREYFKEYIKPVLVAAALDYDVIEGRKEHDVRYGTAEQIRRLRRKKGEQSNSTEEPETDVEQAIELMRERMQVTSEAGIRGDLVIGRHTWKEYVRGIHEGWLGSVDEPAPPAPAPDPSPIHPPIEAPSPSEPHSESNPEVEGDKTSEEPKKEEEQKEAEKKPPFPPSPYLSTTSYASAPLSSHTPQTLEPSAPLHQQHLLGFLKTPQRIYHFFTRRHLADQLGRETAAIVLAAHRPYTQASTFVSSTDGVVATRAPESDAAEVIQTASTWEQQFELLDEELTWHKSVRQARKEGDTAEQVWADDVVIDPRIGARMRKFELPPEEEERADRIGKRLEKGRAVEAQDLRKVKITVGDVDDTA